jgi:hypothetical protein
MRVEENRCKKGIKGVAIFFVENFRFTFFVMISVVTLGLCGCTAPEPFKAYSGDKLPPEKVALVAGYSYEDILFMCGQNVYILDVDGKEDRLNPSEIKLLKKVEVLPGEHTLTAIYKYHDALLLGVAGSRFIETAPRTVSFKAKAGHSYEVYGIIDSASEEPRFWIEDMQSKEIVGGSKP